LYSNYLFFRLIVIEKLLFPFFIHIVNIYVVDFKTKTETVSSVILLIPEVNAANIYVNVIKKFFNRT